MDDINLIGNEKGTTSVETAIIFMLMLTLIFGIIEFGLLLFDKQLLTNASREGARAGIVVGLDRFDPVAADYYVTVSKEEASDFCEEHLITFESGVLQILPPYFDDVDEDGIFDPDVDLLRLHLKYDYNFLFLSAFGIGPIPLNAVSIMRFE